MAKKNDYVKRHDVLLALISHGEKRFRWGEIIRYTPSEVDSIIAGMPAEDARENVRGEWIEDRTEYICSVCGQRIKDEIVYMIEPQTLPGFCPNPNCGADMRGA